MLYSWTYDKINFIISILLLMCVVKILLTYRPKGNCMPKNNTKPTINELSNILGKFEKYSPTFIPSIEHPTGIEAIIISKFPKSQMNDADVELVKFWGAVWNEEESIWYINY